MGEDTRATDARGRHPDGLRAGGAAARRAAGDPSEARPAGDAVALGPFELDETQLTAWGRTVGRVVAIPVVFALRGNLGAGKSVLARAIARGAGVAVAMPSPTFNLLFQYETEDVVINHIDLYRLEDANEVWELGWRELGDDRQIVLIEWPERAEALLPEPRWDVEIAAHRADPLRRVVTLRPVGDPPELPVPPATHE